MTIQIRQAEKNDIETLYGMQAKLGVSKENNYFERCLDEQEQEKRQIFIASGGEDVAYGMLNWAPKYTLYKRLEIPEIQDLNVIPEARRQGIATKLIRYCEQLVFDRGRKYIGISVGLHADFGAAQRLYTKLGYVPDGYGVTYDREPVKTGEIRPVDDDLCLMMMKQLG